MELIACARTWIGALIDSGHKGGIIDLDTLQTLDALLADEELTEAVVTDHTT